MAATPLFRPRRQAIIFGVCAGLGRYFDVDPVLIRFIFVVLAFFGGVGIVAYVVLAAVMPSERSVGLESWQVLQENVREMHGAAVAAGQTVAEVVRTGAGTGRRRYLLGLVLVVLGSLMLMARLGLLWWLRWDVLWPLVLIGLGMLLLLRRPSSP